jgi:hypothetical protein
MADDINKKITIDVSVNTDGLQQLNQYEAIANNLLNSFKALSKPLADTSANIQAINDGVTKAAASVASGIKMVTEAQKGTNDIISKSEEKKSISIIGSAIKTTGELFNIKKILSEKTGGLDTAAATTRLKGEIDNAQKISDSVFTIVTKGIEQQSDAKVRGLETDRKAIENNANLTAADKKQQENAIYKNEDQIKLKAFKDEQKANIAQAVMNGAIAITKAEADLGPVAGTLALGAIVAQTAAQIATIERQQPPAKQALAKGGYFKSDGKGAVLSGYSRTDNTNAYLRSGEAIVVSEAMRDPWARNLVSAINVAYGGRDFSVPNVSRGYAVGGIFTDGGNANRYYNQPVNDQKNLANTVAYQMINNFPPVYVDVKDVNNQQNILAQTINRVNL